MAEGMNERRVVTNVDGLLKEAKERNQISGLKFHRRYTNLATKAFDDVWSRWWAGTPPPRLEVDLILVFEDHLKLVDDALILAIEVEYFSQKGSKNFFEGLQQAQAFAIFGFDGLVLWHLFEAGMKKEEIGSSVQATKEILDGFSLPIVYFACQISKNSKLKCYVPGTYSEEGEDVSYLLSWMRNLCLQNRNPMLFPDKLPAHRRELSNEVRRRRRVIKTVLGIP